MAFSAKDECEDKENKDPMTKKAKTNPERVGSTRALRSKPQSKLASRMEYEKKRRTDLVKINRKKRLGLCKVKLQKSNYSLNLTDHKHLKDNAFSLNSQSVVGNEVPLIDPGANLAKSLISTDPSPSLAKVLPISPQNPSVYGTGCPAATARRAECSLSSDCNFAAPPDLVLPRPTTNDLSTPEKGGAKLHIGGTLERIAQWRQNQAYRQRMTELLASEQEDEETDKEVEEIMRNAEEGRADVQKRKHPRTETIFCRKTDFDPMEDFQGYFKLMNNYPTSLVYPSNVHRLSAFWREKADYERYMGRDWLPGEEAAHVAFLKRVLPETVETPEKPPADVTAYWLLRGRYNAVEAY